MSRQASLQPQASKSNGIALVSGNRHLTHDELTENACRSASALHSIGVWQGDVVALLLRNDFVYFEATIGASLLGAATVPMNWHMTAEEIAYILDDCDAKVVLAHTDLLTEAVLTVCAGRELIAVQTPAEIAECYGLAGDNTAVPGAVPEWYEWISNCEPWQEPAQAVAQPMFYTSGTTGMPKGVKRQPIATEIAAKVAARTGRAFGLLHGPVRSIMSGPLYHSAPNAYALKIIRDGGYLVLQPRFDAAELLRLIEQHQISHLHMVPTMFVRLLKLNENTRRSHDVSSLVHVAHGAAPCPVDVKHKMIDWWGPVIFEYYAMTETGIIACCTSDEWLSHPGTVGRPVEGTQVAIFDESGSNQGTGVPGEICVCSETTPYVTYYRAEEKTAALRRGNFINTGDVGYLDEDGFLYISDRISDMVISGGVNIYPAEIEKVLLAMDEVRDCAMFGVPDDEFGERLVAVIEASAPTSEGQITGFLAGKVAGYKIPATVLFSSHLPREDSGKIKKRILKEAYQAGNLISEGNSQ